MSLGWSLAAVPVLIAMNAFFVAAEYAVVALRPAQIETMRRRGHRTSAGAIERLKANPASAIGAIQVCITMTNLLLGWIGEPAMSALLLKAFSPLQSLAPNVLTAFSTLLSFVIVTLLTVVFSELLPKALTLQHAQSAARLTAAPMLWVQRIIRPLVWIMNVLANAVTIPLGLGKVDDLDKQQVTADELLLLTRMAGEQGALSAPQRALVLNSLTIGRRKASEIMVPRVRCAFLDLQWTMDENRRVLNERLYTRLPLCNGGMDHVVGVVHTNEFFAAYHAEGDTSVLSLIARPPVFAPVGVPLERLLEIFRENQTQMAMLVDEYGGVEGLVTLRDITDELVGEIGDSSKPTNHAP